jgi:hypothetical protein
VNSHIQRPVATAKTAPKERPAGQVVQRIHAVFEAKALPKSAKGPARQRLGAAKAKFKTDLEEVRGEIKAEKALLDARMPAQMARLEKRNADPSERRAWLRDNYSTPLRTLTSRTTLLSRLDQKLGREFMVTANGPEGTYSVAIGVPGLSDPIGTMYVGNAAFEMKEGKDDLGVERDIWVKRGQKKKAGAKEYIKDDWGTITRRYAYAEKSGEQISSLTTNKSLKGRYMQDAEDVNDALTASDATSEMLIPTRKESVEGGGTLSTEEMLFLHQEKGSGPEQRGVSISSTPKLLFGNSGEAFRAVGGRTMKIDLAQIPAAPEDARVPNLINYYSPDSRAQKENWAKSFTWTNDDQVTRVQDPAHFQDSTTKNRELFLRELPLNAVDSWSNPHTEADVLTRGVDGKISNYTPTDQIGLTKRT